LEFRIKVENSAAQKKIKEFIKKIPVFGDLARKLYWRFGAPKHIPGRFVSSEKYWEARYAAGEDSGSGSYGKFADFKAGVINAFVAKESIRSVIEFGCGDGNQLLLAKYPRYAGFDVSLTAVNKCRKKFHSDATKTFDLMDNYAGQSADLVLSLDVIYHLVEDPVFEEYMRKLFLASKRYVAIYSSDFNGNPGSDPHVRARKFSGWIERNLQGWSLIKHIPNRYSCKGGHRTGCSVDFFIYERVNGGRSNS
jgi:hypothetical protein